MEPVQLRGGRYELIRKLGEGSQGQTFEAVDKGSKAKAGPLADQWERYVRDQKTGGEVPRAAKLVAIKCFRIGTAKAWKDVELAEREARTLASLDHPRLPKYFEHFEEDGALYLVMEKIEGESLAALRAKGSMSVEDVTRMLEDIADALRYLHGRAPHVVHRDIKPGNIIRRPDGSFALVDFGAVRDRLKPAGGSTVVGTFGYMAPEQFQGRASTKSDVYGLGATAITMLTGVDPEELPHEGLGIDVERALPKRTPAALVRALSSMLVADPDQRIDSVDDALAMLREREGPRRVAAPGLRLSRKQQRKLEKERRAETDKQRAREEKKRRRAERHARRPPVLARLLGRLGLLVALIVVWATVGLALPLVLIVLSLLFGSRLRRAASACVGAARRTQAALGRASMWLSGDRADDRAASPAPGAKVRVGTEPPRVRAVVEEEEEAPAEHADAWMEERLEKEAQRERMRMHARPPGKRKHWGR